MEIAGLRIDGVEEAMGCPTEDWHGRCAEVAHALLRTKLVEGRYAYGHYRGPISPNGHWARRRGMGFVRHAWVIGEDGAVYDPTRWSFTDSNPCIAVVGPDDPRFGQYDEGGTIWVKEKRGGLPPLCPDRSDHERQGRLLDVPEELDTWRKFIGLPNPAAINQLHWAANLLPEEHGSDVRLAYRWLQEVNLSGLIPIDFQRMAGLEE